MKVQQRTQAYLFIHIAVFLYGFTAILGKVIAIPETGLVWWRMMLTALSLLMFPGLIKQLRLIPKKKILQLIGIGTVVALHWIFFFGAVKFSNVSVTLSCMATATMFTAVIEPLILKKKFQWYELMLGVLIIPGVYMIYSFTGFYGVGISMALFSAFLAAIFNILNKKMVSQYDPVSITFIELGSGWLMITPLVCLYYSLFPEKPFLPTGFSDLLYLLILALVCTSFAYVINLKALKVLSSFAVNLTINLEPVYGIVLAWILFDENKELEGGFYLGAGVILASVFIHPFLERWFGDEKI